MGVLSLTYLRLIPAEVSDGSVTARATPGGGSAFTFCLPDCLAACSPALLPARLLSCLLPWLPARLLSCSVCLRTCFSACCLVWLPAYMLFCLPICLRVWACLSYFLAILPAFESPCKVTNGYRPVKNICVSFIYVFMYLSI